MKGKKVLLLLLVVSLFLTACSPKEVTEPTGGNEVESTESVTTTDGVTTVETTGMGFDGEVLVKSTFEEGSITAVEVVDHSETPEIFERVWPILESAILHNNSYELDTITGATFTSGAILRAVEEAYTELKVEPSLVAEPEKLEDAETQLVVVGGGPSGLAAAISARESGIDNVILVEKMGVLSGNGKFDLNFFDVFNSEAQKANGIEDSKEKFIEDKQNAGETPERLEAWANETEGIDAWLRSFGVELNHNFGGRSHMYSEDLYAGQEIQRQMEKHIDDLDVDVRLETEGKDLIIEDGKVVGVTVEHKGQTYNIHADSVLIATGGFSTNKELLEEYAPGHEILTTSNQIGTTGDYVSLLKPLDVQFYKMDATSVFPSILKPSRDLTNAGPGTIFVNINGERFVDERVRGLDLGKAVLDQPDNKVWMIIDNVKPSNHANVRKQVGQGKFIKADSLEELAEKIDIDYDSLLKTIEDYNTHVENETEDEFGQSPEMALELDGVFYASMVESAIHMTKGGVLTNENASVLKNDDSVLDNLFAAGEVTWQSGGYAQSVVWGKIAGRSAAEHISNK